ncbi:pectinesterase, partial [Trifolium pratense]
IGVGVGVVLPPEQSLGDDFGCGFGKCQTRTHGRMLPSLTKVEIQKEKYSLKSGQFPSWIHRNAQQLLKRKEKDIVFDVVVAKDGSGNFTKVVDAVNAAPSSSTKLFIIQIKRGVYYENVEVAKNNIVMIGQGMS